MAKRKTPKVQDLKPQNITTEELESLQNLVNALNRTQMEIGSLESRKHSMLHQVTGLQTQMQTMQKTFEDTYGKVDINIQDGTITYAEDVKANS
tara:strand:+ start:643 stop:924 length:282 start_codon:yes stop_codon:yes gene_type:complete